MAEDSSLWVQRRIVRSMPEDMIWVGDMKRVHFIEDVWPPAVDEGVVAITCDEGSHIRRWPSKLADSILSWPGCVSFERTSTELSQSSCSNEATCSGGMRARTYSRARVVSAEIPFAVRYSSRLVRRYVPLTRNSKGVGFSDCNSVFTRVERAYRRKFVGTRMGPVLSGSERSVSLVERDILTWVAGSV